MNRISETSERKYINHLLNGLYANELNLANRVDHGDKLINFLHEIDN